jgi:hypothetical protein
MCGNNSRAGVRRAKKLQLSPRKAAPLPGAATALFSLPRRQLLALKLPIAFINMPIPVAVEINADHQFLLS